LSGLRRLSRFSQQKHVQGINDSFASKPALLQGTIRLQILNSFLHLLDILKHGLFTVIKFFSERFLSLLKIKGYPLKIGLLSS
jgi:hypothetical protein